MLMTVESSAGRVYLGEILFVCPLQFLPSSAGMYIRGFSYAHSELTLLFTLQTKLIQVPQGGYISKLYITFYFIFVI